MNIILLFSIMYLIGFVLTVSSSVSPKKNDKSFNYFYLLALGIFVIKISFSTVIRGFNVDIGCFEAWSSRAFEVGIPNFYQVDPSEYFVDYPPGYIYVLYLLGAIRSAFNLSPSLSVAVIKLPAIICDVVTGFILFNFSRRYLKDVFSAVLSVLYMLNPAVFINSTIWGQVDSVFTLFLVVSFIYVWDKKLIQSTIIFAVAVIIKPQALLFTPVYIIAYTQYDGLIFTSKKTDFPKWLRLAYNYAFTLVLGVGVLIIGTAPFVNTINPVTIIAWLVEKYSQTMSGYNYATVNAWNFFALVGANWVKLDTTFLFMSYGAWGTFFMAATIGLVCLLCVKRKNTFNFFYGNFLLIFSVFTFGSMMHERYMFPAVILLFLTYAVTKKMYLLAMAAVCSITQFINVGMVLIHYEYQVDMSTPIIALVSLVNIAVCVCGFGVPLKAGYQDAKKLKTHVQK